VNSKTIELHIEIVMRKFTALIWTAVLEWLLSLWSAGAQAL
jgi:hypothetical protein